MRRYLILSLSLFVLIACSSKPILKAINQSHFFAENVYQNMSAKNEANLYKAPKTSDWSKKGVVIQGVPRGDATPEFWSEDIVNKSLTSSEPWNAITGWVTIFEASKNKARNVRVALGDMDIWVLRGKSVRHAKWENITPSGANISWAAYFANNMIQLESNAQNRSSDKEFVSYSLSNQRFPIHGGTHNIAMNGKDVLASFIRVKAWLEPDNKSLTSDVNKAKVLMSVGADYYPSVETSVRKGSFANANYLPGAGGSRFKYLTTEPSWFYMATVAADDLSNVDKSSEYYKSGGRTYLTKDEWLNNHPNLLIN
ncbi:hypothetical protein P7F88_12235 [Vibrio hannami]|uniref:hypothetical protein n=1 Tax=Vibrio hannami TaxID=2717094 RepID=UPI00240FF05D|nr:hypothetical protein [Vibrio hannami]MDG3086813.1 hypothetical protein [Vibrio hannami]